MSEPTPTKPKLSPLKRAQQMRARADALEKRAMKSERARRTRRLIVAGSYFESADCLDAWEALTEAQRKTITAHLPSAIARTAAEVSA